MEKRHRKKIKGFPLKPSHENHVNDFISTYIVNKEHVSTHVGTQVTVQ